MFQNPTFIYFRILKRVVLVFGLTLIFLFLPVIFISFNNFSKVYAASPEDIKKHIQSKVDDQTLNNIPNWNISNGGQDSFGRFLWGLAGCETGGKWNETAVGYGDLFYGLFQFTPGTWESIKNMMGTPTANIYDGLAQVDAVIFMLQNADRTGGFNNWPGCTNGIAEPGDHEWWEFEDAWPPPPTGDIIVTPAVSAEQVPNLEIWLSGQTPQQASVVNSTVFSGLTPGVYKVHLRASGPGVDSGYSIESSLYTLCDSGQGGCVRSQCNPLHGSCSLAFTEEAYGKYHVWDAQRWVKSVSQHEIEVGVNVPPNGFVDLMYYLCPSAAGKKSCYPYGYSGKSNSKEPFANWNFDPSAIFVKDAYAAERSPLPPPKPFDPPVLNLPACSDGTYGGSSNADPANLRVRITAYNAQKVEYEAYENGNLFYNSLRDEGRWQNLNTASAYSLYVNHWNLSPGNTYTWRVRSGNETQWSHWWWGNFWTVPFCGPSPAPSNFQISNLPKCSDDKYSGAQVGFDIARANKIEARLYKDGNLVWDNVGNSWDVSTSSTWFEVTWSNLYPTITYTWQVRAGNGLGWSDWASGPSWNVQYCSPPDLQAYRLRPSALEGFPPYWVFRGTTVSFEASVLNAGFREVSDSFKVEWYVNNVSIPGYIDGAQTSLHAGGLRRMVVEAAGHDSARYTFENEGTHTVKFCTDTTYKIEESDETNNCRTVEINVSSNIPPDLFITGCSGSEGSGVCVYGAEGNLRTAFVEGEPMTLKFTLKSNYASARNFWLDIWAPYSGQITSGSGYCNQASPLVSRFIDVLQIGSTPYTITFPAPRTGNYKLGIVGIDSRGQNSAFCAVEETKETNNAAFFNYSAKSLPAKEDRDADGFTNGKEIYIGTDPTRSCPSINISDGKSIDAWPPDVDKNRVVNIFDVLALSPYMGAVCKL